MRLLTIILLLVGVTNTYQLESTKSDRKFDDYVIRSQLRFVEEQAVKALLEGRMIKDIKIDYEVDQVVLITGSLALVLFCALILGCWKLTKNLKASEDESIATTQDDKFYEALKVQEWVEEGSEEPIEEEKKSDPQGSEESELQGSEESDEDESFEDAQEWRSPEIGATEEIKTQEVGAQNEPKYENMHHALTMLKKQVDKDHFLKLFRLIPGNILTKLETVLTEVYGPLGHLFKPIENLIYKLETNGDYEELEASEEPEEVPDLDEDGQPLWDMEEARALTKMGIEDELVVEPERFPMSPAELRQTTEDLFAKIQKNIDETSTLMALDKTLKCFVKCTF